MDAGRMFAIALSAALVDNLVLGRLVGVCPLMGAPERLRWVAGLGLGLMIAITTASVTSAAINRYVLMPLDLGYLRTITLVFIVVAVALVAVRVMGKGGDELRHCEGRSVTGLVSNCAVLAVALLAIEKGYGMVETLVYAVSAGLGLVLVMVIMAGLRQRMETSPVPTCFRGLPIGLITSGLMALAFLGFLGMGS